SVVFGATGSGKTTLLKNIITQDRFRVLGPHEDQHRIPMLIFDGKGDQEFLSDLLPAIEVAGRMHQLRVISPSRPDISVRYNPFFGEHGLYQEHANFVFESFDLKQDFFHGHQATYLSDLVCVLAHTGKPFNIHDVLVLAHLMTDNRLGTLHSHLHVKVPRHYRFPGLEARIYPRLHAVSHVEGANLRFKDPEVVRRNGRLATRTGRSTWM